MPRVESNAVTCVSTTTPSVFRFGFLKRFPIIHGITTRDDSLPGCGDINISGRLSREMAVSNRCVWAEEIGVDASSIVSGRQVHGNRVGVVDETHAGCGANVIEEALPQTDALVTKSIGLPLLVYTADCVPTIVYDPIEHALGLAHAGWRGTVANVVGSLVSTMQSEFGSSPSNLVVGIGPSIGPCCYEVGDEVIDAWIELGLDQQRNAIRNGKGKFHLDLWKANALAFRASGVAENQIHLSGLCTKCESHRFFSRRAGNSQRGLFATIAALTPLPTKFDGN